MKNYRELQQRIDAGNERDAQIIRITSVLETATRSGVSWEDLLELYSDIIEESILFCSEYQSRRILNRANQIMRQAGEERGESFAPFTLD